MSTSVSPVSAPRATRLGALWNSAVGKKALMAVTGIVLFLFVLVHMIGNLQVFQGAAKINHYAELLRISPPFLWFTRIVLLVAVFVHALAGIELWMERQRARPVGYQDYRPVVSSTASRTMIWSGLLILLFVVYHLLDLTIGVVNPRFEHGQVYANLVASLSRAVGAAIYLVAMIGLGFHLWHGLYSMFQSLGLSNRGISPTIQKFAIGFAVLLTLGFSAVPLAVILGLVG
ncbi:MULTISPECIES: succinate dehydrogenase cytochrome b subunit [Anaeromyxobacter]|uniref:succinate dehydrogenase cytochrome b subunit n=1 Tax=Anaeromyxobacter TaxID=161492 RepID=UPI002104BD65|nr:MULTISPECIES: succinate dehydrogenase cytochrome b subunit [unclassified Anaeromyxobacter]